MNLALILVILSAITGLIYFLDIILWSKKRKHHEKPNRIIEFSRSFFPVFFGVLILRTFIGEGFRIPSGSLEPTLKVGDFVAVNKSSYGLRLPVLETKIMETGKPQKGEIAVFRWPPDPSYDFIKRVIGVPGDTISYKNKVLTINGKKADQEFVEYTVDESSGATVAKYKENIAGVEHYIYVRPEAPASDFEIVVPEGKYFMMGDNRDFSSDSRMWGFVDDANLRGKAFMVWMSFNANDYSVRWSRIGHFIKQIN